MYCRLINNTAVDVVPSYKDRFHQGIHSQFVECPDDVQAGWIYNADEDTWSAPPEIEEEEEESSE
jgi:hypothetical protein